ncbi:hypothetical protein JCM5350_005618 [Sporobolomyces pararoseus]
MPKSLSRPKFPPLRPPTKSQAPSISHAKSTISTDEESILTPAAPSEPPLLPTYLQEKILRSFLEMLQEEDSMTAFKKLSYLPSLSRVSRVWKLIVGSEYTNYGCFDLRERSGDWRIKGKARETRDSFKPLSLKETWEEDVPFAPGARCGCCFQAGRTGPKLLMDGPESDSPSMEWRKTAKQVFLKFGRFRRIELVLYGTEAGKHIGICQQFSRLKALLIISAEAYVPIRFSSLSFFPTISTTLARLDLARIIIRDWELPSLPAVRTLTLSFVRFESENPNSSIQEIDKNEEADSSSSTSNEVLCRKFFDSFKNLKALGIEGIENLSPTSLSRLRVFSVERLFIGDPRLGSHLHNSDDCTDCFLSIPLASPLTRFFHCQIKHLVLSPRQNSLPLLQSLLTSRNEQQLCPPFLRRLETIKLAVPLSEDQDPTSQEYQFEWRKAELEEQVQSCLRGVNLENVEIKWWCPASYENCEASVSGWTPSES